MKSLTILWPLVAALTGVPAASYALQLGYAAKEINLRAGPSRDYPVVAVIERGVSFVVDGCVADYRWCDVTVGRDRGWAYAGNIVYSYQGASVPLLGYGAAIGIGIIVFSVGDYWDSHYRNRPWYSQRQRWVDRPPPVIRPQPRARPGQVIGHPAPDGTQRTPDASQNPPQTHVPDGAQPPVNRVRPSGAPRQDQPPGTTQQAPRVRAPAADAPPMNKRHPAEATQEAGQAQPQRGTRRLQPWEEDPARGRK